VAELVDAPDSKSGALKSVSVRVRPLAPIAKSRVYSNVSPFFSPRICNHKLPRGRFF
jgi:hypothetical protein